MKKVVSYLPAMIQRVSIAAGWLGLAFIVYATLSPIDARPVITQAHFEHFAAFAMVGLAFGLGYPNRLRLVIAIVLGSAFGLEALQLLTPDRHGRVLDALIKASGGICGISVGQLMWFLWRTLKSLTLGVLNESVLLERSHYRFTVSDGAHTLMSIFLFLGQRVDATQA